MKLENLNGEAKVKKKSETKPSGLGTTLKKRANESFYSQLWFLFSLLTAALISLACKETLNPQIRFLKDIGRSCQQNKALIKFLNSSHMLSEFL